MALTDYTPTLLWFADNFDDLVTPTGTTPTLTNSPVIAGTTDKYADFDGTNYAVFAPAAPVMEVGAGDFTLVMKARIDNFVGNDRLFSNWDGAGSSGTSHGLILDIESGANRRIRLYPPPRASSFSMVTATTALTAGQDFIVAFRRSSGTCTIWLDADASGGMVSNTPFTNAFGTSSLGSCGNLAFGADYSGANPTDMRLYWVAGFDAAISDTDIQLSTWDDEANLKAAWAGASGVKGRSLLLGVG